MIALKRIVEQQGMEGQYYDLGKDFSNFKRTLDGASEQVKQKFEQAIGAKLVGKRVRARASRGYKQYVKEYEFDVARITLDDYYDNYVVVAHDNTTPKPKEYFLKPGFKISILSAATGQPSPQKGGKPETPEPNVSPQPSQPQFQSPTPPIGHTPSEMSVKENENDHYDAYSIDEIERDIKLWLPGLLLKPETILRDFTNGLGWQKGNVALFNLKIPKNALKTKINPDIINRILSKLHESGATYELTKMEYDDAGEEWNIRIKKTMGHDV